MVLLDVERAVAAFEICDADCTRLLSDALTLLRCALLAVEFRPPFDVLIVDLTLVGALLTVEEGIPESFGKVPSSVVGRALLLLPCRLRVESGRGGGAIGLETGEKKLERRLSFGVDGSMWILSIVRSLRDGLDALDLLGLLGGSSIV